MINRDSRPNVLIKSDMQEIFFLNSLLILSLHTAGIIKTASVKLGFTPPFLPGLHINSREAYIIPQCQLSMLTYAEMCYKLPGLQASIHTVCYQPVTCLYQHGSFGLVLSVLTPQTQANHSAATAVRWSLGTSGGCLDPFI